MADQSEVCRRSHSPFEEGWHLKDELSVVTPIMKAAKRAYLSHSICSIRVQEHQSTMAVSLAYYGDGSSLGSLSRVDIVFVRS